MVLTKPSCFCLFQLESLPLIICVHYYTYLAKGLYQTQMSVLRSFLCLYFEKFPLSIKNHLLTRQCFTTVRSSHSPSRFQHQSPEKRNQLKQYSFTSCKHKSALRRICSPLFVHCQRRPRPRVHLIRKSFYAPVAKKVSENK